jgi:DNA-directed RNA polymerase subunit N
MLITVRCFTCGKVIADKWEAYEREVRAQGEATRVQACAPADSMPLRAPRGKILDDLAVTKICCRLHFLSNVDLMDLL